MNIEELRRKHNNYCSTSHLPIVTKLSVEFALSILEEIADDESDLNTIDLVWNKIQELKTYLDGSKD